jgi:hypothetical protein
VEEYSSKIARRLFPLSGDEPADDGGVRTDAGLPVESALPTISPEEREMQRLQRRYEMVRVIQALDKK